MRIGVIADDLTGALDTGVQFRNWSLSVASFINKLPEDENSTSEVIVIDTETREVGPEEAYRLVYDSTRKLKKQGIRCFYKKIDSTLRGNIGAEIDAVMDASKAKRAVFVPTYPMYNRTVVDGRMLVNGVPLDLTEYSSELCVNISNVREIISAQSRRSIANVDLEVVKKGPEFIKNEIKSIINHGAEIIIFDSQNEKHLIDILSAMESETLFVGSAGLASELPSALTIRRGKPILSICGSTRSISRKQTEELRDRLDFLEIEINAIKILEGKVQASEEVQRCSDLAVDALRSGRNVSLVTYKKDLTKSIMPETERSRIHESITSALGEIAYCVIKAVDIQGLILTGGSTSLNVFKKLGWVKVSILNELEPGIPLIEVCDDFVVATKAGGFGVEDTLIQVTQRLRRIIP